MSQIADGCCKGRDVKVCGTVKVDDSISMPDLDVGKETAMNMRYRGKQVYATLVEFGSLPNSGYKKVAHGIQNTDWLHVSNDDSYAYTPNGMHFVTVNRTDIDSVKEAWQAGVDRTHITVGAGINRSETTATFCILYTKMDEAEV